MTAPANKVTYKEIFWSLAKTIPLMILVGLLYKSLRSQLSEDQYLSVLADIVFFFLLLSIARWGVGNILKRIREEEHSGNH